MSHSGFFSVFVLEFAPHMDDQKKTLIVTGAVLLIILTLVISLIFFLARFISGRRVAVNVSPSPTPVTQTSGSAGVGSVNSNTNTPQTNSNSKTYTGQGFNLSYPNNWGVVTCNNSQNFEFDPNSSTDNLKIACDRAIKSVTVLVTDNLTCQGETVKLGNNTVIRTAEGTKGSEADYRWCVVNPNGYDLDITHRVSNTDRPSSSKQDFSAQVEQMISSMNFTQGS